jgi:hypothetical protein
MTIGLALLWWFGDVPEDATDIAVLILVMEISCLANKTHGYRGGFDQTLGMLSRKQAIMQITLSAASSNLSISTPYFMLSSHSRHS